MYIKTILLGVALMACHTQTENSINTDISMNIELSIYPSGGGEVGYTMVVEDKLLKVLTKKLKIQGNTIVLGDIIEVKEKNLSLQQVDSIKEYVNTIKKLELDDANADLTLDTWVFNLVVDGKQLGKFNSFTLSKPSTPQDIKKAIKYLINLSPFKIDLHGFS